MADNRDYRLRIDLCFPPEAKSNAEEIRDAVLKLYTHAVVIKEDSDIEERSFVDLERCGHRLGLPCEKIARWEVGRGKVI